jgi:alkylated DNA repair dioxygenase AlkB
MMTTRVSENLLPMNGEVYLFDNLFSHAECNRLFNSLLDSVKWKQEPIKLFGKWKMQPRLTSWYGDPKKKYTYSGITMDARYWIEPLLEIKNKIQELIHIEFNSALLNLYRNGQDSMGWHRDNEKALGNQPVIGSVSFGAPRKFQLQHISNKNSKITMTLSSGSFLFMQGETQHYWQHCVPKQRDCKDARINITFRNII